MHLAELCSYLAVDYGRSEFYLSQAIVPDDQRQTDIKTVKPPGSSSKLGTGAIVGIAVSAAVVILLICVLVWWFKIRPWKKRRESRRFKSRMEAEHKDLQGFYGVKESEEDEVYAKKELDATETIRGSVASRQELESPPLPASPFSQTSRGSIKNGEMAEMEDYWSQRTMSGTRFSPVELPTGRWPEPTSDQA